MGTKFDLVFQRFQDPFNPNYNEIDTIKIEWNGWDIENREVRFQAFLDYMVGLLEPDGWEFLYASVNSAQEQFGSFTPTEPE